MPNKVKELRGTDRTDRRAQGAEIEFSKISELPPPPDNLRAYGKKEWVIVTTEYYNLGMLNVTDLSALMVYCSAWDDFVECQAELEVMQKNGEGKFYTTDSGYSQIRPQTTLMEKAKMTIKDFGNMFGLNPVARNKMGISGEQGKDDFGDQFD